MSRNLCAAIALIVFSLTASVSADLSRELQIERDLSQMPATAGTLVRLNAGDTNFAALHLATEHQPVRGAVILLHDAWGNADSPEITGPLRRGLAQSGWETLALQLPTAYPGENAKRWAARNQTLGERIDAARRWFESRDLTEPTLLAPGASASLALPYAASRKPGELRALVLISGHSTIDPEQRKSLVELGLPVLDLVAEFDHTAVLLAAASRRLAMSTESELVFQSREFSGARPGFGDSSDGLVAEVRAWLAVYATP